MTHRKADIEEHIFEAIAANGIRGRRPGERQAVASEVSPNGHEA